MIRMVDVSKLPEAARGPILVLYREALKAEDARMTMEEAAWLYGFAYATVRWYVAQGRIRTVGRSPNRRITHAAMRAYLGSKHPGGCKRKALRNAQQRIG